MKAIKLFAVALTLCCAGCANESSTTKETTVDTPEGSTTVTEETKVETSGENPPATPDAGATTPANP